MSGSKKIVYAVFGIVLVILGYLAYRHSCGFQGCGNPFKSTC